MPDEPGHELLQRFVHGDRAAFEALFRAYQHEVLRWALRILRDRSAADDVLVEAFWRAFRSCARYDPSRSFGAWMRRITTHVAIDHLNAARRHRWLPLELAGHARPGGRDELPAGRGEPELSMAGPIAQAFRTLPPKLRVVATLALIEECSLAEIAEALGVPIGTVKSRLFRATRHLRKELARLGVHA
jgi:RNA polymerase sigma-70 factor (ECF subfamily)